MTGQGTTEEHLVALARVDELLRNGDLTPTEASTVREQLHQAVDVEEVTAICKTSLAGDQDSHDWGHPGDKMRDLSGSVLGALAAIEGPAATVAEELDTTDGIARRRLGALHEEGAVNKRKTASRTTDWWRDG